MFKWHSAGCLSGNSPLYIDIYVYIPEEIPYNALLPVGGAGAVPSSVKGFEI